MNFQPKRIRLKEAMIELAIPGYSFNPRNPNDGPWTGLRISPEDWLKTEAEKLIVGEDEIRSKAIAYEEMAVPNDPGIYFLFEWPELIYIGKSQQPFFRIRQHREKGWNFDKFACLLGVPFLHIENVENFYIHRHTPPRNQKYLPVHKHLVRFLK